MIVLLFVFDPRTLPLPVLIRVDRLTVRVPFTGRLPLKSTCSRMGLYICSRQQPWLGADHTSRAVKRIGFTIAQKNQSGCSWLFRRQLCQRCQ